MYRYISTLGHHSEAAMIKHSNLPTGQHLEPHPASDGTATLLLWTKSNLVAVVDRIWEYSL